jgi:hypothetical protein
LLLPSWHLGNSLSRTLVRSQPSFSTNPVPLLARDYIHQSYFIQAISDYIHSRADLHMLICGVPGRYRGRIYVTPPSGSRI